MPVSYFGDGRIDNDRIYAGTGYQFGFVTISGETGSLESLTVGQNFDIYGVPAVPLASGGLTLTDGSNVTLEELGPGGLVNGFSPFARIGINYSDGGVASGSVDVLNGSTLTVVNDLLPDGSGEFAAGYSPLRVGGGFGGFGEFDVSGAGSAAFIVGDAARFEFGRSGGNGSLNVSEGGLLGTFGLTVGREGFATAVVEGQGSEIRVGLDYGNYGPAYAGLSGSLVVGRDFNGRGILAVFDGGVTTVQNNPGYTDGPSVLFGRGEGSAGYGLVAGAGATLNVSQVGPLDDGSSGVLKLGDGGRGVLAVEGGGTVNVTGDGAFVSVGEDRGGAVSSLQSQLIIRSGGTMTVDSSENGADTQTTASIHIGRTAGAEGKLVIDGAGSRLDVISRNAANEPVPGDLNFGAAVQIGREGQGELEITNGGKLVIDGGDDLFPILTVGRGDTGAPALGYALVSGAGSSVEIIGTNTTGTSVTDIGEGGGVRVGLRDGAEGTLVISDGGSVEASRINGLSQIGADTGSTGSVIVEGAGSYFYAGQVLTVGADMNFLTGQAILDGGGVGTLTLRDGAYAAAGATFVGDSGTLNLGATLSGDTTVTGTLNVGGENDTGAGAIIGDLDASAASVVFEALDFVDGSIKVDTLSTTGDLDVTAGQVSLDLSNLARAEVGQSIAILDAGGALAAGFSASNLSGTTGLFTKGVQVSAQRVGETISISITQAPDKTVGLFGGDLSIVEGDPGDSTEITFTVLRSGDLSTTMDVTFDVSGGTAVAADFEGAALPGGTASFAAGEDSATFTISLEEDDNFEGDETFNVVLTSASTGNASAVTILNESTTVTITEDDLAASVTGDISGGGAFNFVQIDPATTFLRVDPDDSPVGAPVVLDLENDLGIAAGDIVFISVQGSYQFDTPQSGDRSNVIGVFSGSNTLLAQDQVDRVQDAILAPTATSIYTGPTLPNGYARDIAQDFDASDAVIEVPDGATHLFLAPRDDRLADNIDPDGDFGVEVFSPLSVGVNSTGSATVTGYDAQVSGLVVGYGAGSTGELTLEDTDFGFSVGFLVGGDGGEGRLILDTRSDIVVTDPGTYGAPTAPGAIVGEAGGNGYLAILGGSTVRIDSDLEIINAVAVQGGYNNLSIGAEAGLGAVLVEGEGSTLTAYGYGARINVGRDGGSGQLIVRDGGTVETFSLNAGRREGDGFVQVTGAGSTLHLSSEFGLYGLQEYRGSSTFSTIGRENGSGSLLVTDGGRVLVENVDGVTDVSVLRFGRDYGSFGFGEVSGEGSRIDIIQHGLIGDNYSGRTGLRVGEGGEGELNVINGADILIQGDSAHLSVALGRDGQGQYSSLEITSGATITVDSQNYGRDAASGYQRGSRAEVGVRRNTEGSITVDGQGSILNVTSSSVVAGDYQTAEIYVGGYGTGRLNVSNSGLVTARELVLGTGQRTTNTGVYYGRGYLSITSGGTVDLYTPDNPLKAGDPDNQPSAYRGLRMSTYASGNYSRADIDGAGSTLTVSGGAGRIEIGRRGEARLNITDGGLVQGFFIEAGRDGSGYVTVDGAGSQLVSESQFGEFGYGARGRPPSCASAAMKAHTAGWT